MSRRTLTEEQWELDGWLSPGREGHAAAAAWTTGCLWTRSCGWLAMRRAGATCQRYSASGQGCMPGSDAGRMPVSGNDFSIAWPTRRTLNTSSSTAPSRKSTPMRRAQRGVEAAAIGRFRGGRRPNCMQPSMPSACRSASIRRPPRGDRPEAETLLTGLSGVGRAIADAAGDAGSLRALSSPTLAPPRRWRQPEPNWPNLHRLAPRQGTPSGRMLLQQAQGFRRIALRCEKTITAFMDFVHLACAMIWLR